MSKLLETARQYGEQQAWRDQMTASDRGRNTSGLEPLGRAVLVEYYQPERKESVIFIPDQVSDHSNMIEQRAVVVAIGPACWPDEPARAKVGDRVLISKMAGYAAVGPTDGKRYRFINDRDIFAKITGDGHAER